MARLLYPETDTSHIGIGTRLLQVRDDMNCGHDGVLHNVVLQPIAFASKSLLSTEWHYSSTKCEAPGILH